VDWLLWAIVKGARELTIANGTGLLFRRSAILKVTFGIADLWNSWPESCQQLFYFLQWLFIQQPYK